jgi:hypothetical protein
VVPAHFSGIPALAGRFAAVLWNADTLGPEMGMFTSRLISCLVPLIFARIYEE